MLLVPPSDGAPYGAASEKREREKKSERKKTTTAEKITAGRSGRVDSRMLGKCAVPVVSTHIRKTARARVCACEYAPLPELHSIDEVVVQHALEQLL